MSAPTYPLTQTPITTNFSITATQIQLTDLYGSTGAYVGTYNIPNSAIRGVFKVIAPDGTVIYNNTSYVSADINGSTPLWVKNISLPTNADGSYVSGIYIAILSTQITDGVNAPYIVVNTATYDFSYTAPTVSITQTVDCISPNFTTVDTTNYDINGGTASITRDLTLDYPYGSAGAGSPLTTSADTISTGTFYQGTQTTVVSTDISILKTAIGSYPTFTITDTVTGSKEVLVDCTFICAISCCIQALEVRMSNAANGVNQVLFEIYEYQLDQVMNYVGLSFLAISCGQVTKVNGYIAKIQQIAACTDKCDCGTDTPSLVIGLGGNSVNVVVQSGGSPVIVTPVTVGSVTTYTVTLSSSFVNKVNASYNSVVSSDDSSVTVTITTASDGTKTYDLSVALPAEQDRVEVKCSITWPIFGGFAAGDVIVTIASVLITGTKFQSPTIACDDPSNGNWINLTNCFKVSGFFTGSTDNNYKIILDNANGAGSKNAAYTFATDTILRDATAGTFFFRFLYGNSGSPFMAKTNGGMLNNKQELTLVISE